MMIQRKKRISHNDWDSADASVGSLSWCISSVESRASRTVKLLRSRVGLEGKFGVAECGNQSSVAGRSSSVSFVTEAGL